MVKFFPKRKAVTAIPLTSPRAGDTALLKASVNGPEAPKRTKSNGQSLGSKVAGATKITGGVA